MKSMKKILTTLIAAALLISSAGCQVQQPQATQSAPEPAPQAIVLNVDSPTDTSEKHIDTSAIIAQITAGFKVKLDTAEREKEAAQVAKEESKASHAAGQKKVQDPRKSRENGNLTLLLNRKWQHPPLPLNRLPPSLTPT